MSEQKKTHPCDFCKNPIEYYDDELVWKKKVTGRVVAKIRCEKCDRDSEIPKPS